MASPKAEQSVFWLGIFASLTMITALVFTAILPSMNVRWSSETAETSQHVELFKTLKKDPTIKAGLETGYTADELHGRLVYQREGCMYCHSQYIRPLSQEMIRYGLNGQPAPPADEREYVYDEPHFFGTKRNGPDLSRVGGKYTDDWQLSHLYNPQQMVPGSIMPAFTWLFTNANQADPSMNPVASNDAKCLVAYLQTLVADREIYDPNLVDKNGNPTPGYRPWLLPKDKENSLQASEDAVNRAKTPIYEKRP